MENQSEEKEPIELLPEKKFEEYPLSKKLTTWVVSVGRIIIIATELIAFSVFIGRIKLDRELTDLTDALEIQLTILENAQDFEEDFKDTQERLRIIKELRQKQIPSGTAISLLSSLLPPDVTLMGLTLQPDVGESYLVAKTNSTLAFAQAIQQLKSSPQIEGIALTSGRFSAKDGTYHFSLAIEFVDDGRPPSF